MATLIFSRPYGTLLFCPLLPGTEVLGYYQLVPTGRKVKWGGYTFTINVELKTTVLR
jgi:hypothetical protein